ncbi:MAG: hypothetical protein AB2551_03995 [Candidatus Thiodiazotropha sp.]
MRKIIVALCLAILAAGCATTPNTTPIRSNFADEDRFVPVNLQLNTDDSVSSYDSELFSYLYDSLNESRVFARINTSRQRYQYTINIDYSWNHANTTSAVIGGAVTIASLGLAPTQYLEDHSMQVEILNGDNVIYNSKYTERITSSWAFFHDGIGDRKLGIDKLLKQLFEDLRSKKILPLNSESS